MVQYCRFHCRFIRMLGIEKFTVFNATMSATLANVTANNYRLMAIRDECAWTVELDIGAWLEPSTSYV
jgi:hypothetical protein|tara:strand:+ start:1507 stop:1710 length:204 start_codon:yes stop_codon:yes gene_type:complete